MHSLWCNERPILSDIRPVNANETSASCPLWLFPQAQDGKFNFQQWVSCHIDRRQTAAGGKGTPQEGYLHHRSFGQLAILCPGCLQRWHTILGLATGLRKAPEPAEEIDVSLFSLTSFFRRFSANSWARVLSPLFFLWRLDPGLLLSLLLVLRLPRLPSCSSPAWGEDASLESSSLDLAELGGSLLEF